MKIVAVIKLNTKAVLCLMECILCLCNSASEKQLISLTGKHHDTNIMYSRKATMATICLSIISHAHKGPN